MDYEAIAKKYGGVIVDSPVDGGIDYDALAAKYGGVVVDSVDSVEAAPQPQTNVVKQTKEAAKATSQRLGAIPKEQRTQSQRRALTDARLQRAGNTLGDIFGGSVIGQGIGTRFANIAEKKAQQSVMNNHRLQELKLKNPEAYNRIIAQGTGITQTQLPTRGQVLGDIGRAAANFIPVGKIAQGTKAGVQALPLVGKKIGEKAASRIGGIVAGGASGFAIDAASKAAEGDKIKPGAGTAIGLAIPGAGLVSRGVGTLRRAALGTTSGLGVKTLQVIEDAFAKGGDEAKAVLRGLRNEQTPDQLVDTARESINKLVNSRREQYLSNLGAAKMQSKLDIKPVANKFDEALADFKVTTQQDGSLNFSKSNIRFDKEAQKKINDVYEGVKAFFDDPSQHTGEGFDSLKKGLDDLFVDSSQSRAFISKVRDQVRKELSNIPGYDNVTKTFEKQTSQLNEIMQGLSLGQKSNDKLVRDRAFKKLTSVFRSNQDIREQLLKELDDVSGSNLIQEVAGQQASDILPKGLSGRLGSIATGVGAVATGSSGGLSILPLIATLPAFSPKVVAQISRAAGLSRRYSQKLLDILGMKSGLISPGDAVLGKKIDEFGSEIKATNELIKKNPALKQGGYIKLQDRKTLGAKTDKLTTDNIPDELKPLMNEAKKYKSADEFVYRQKKLSNQRNESGLKDSIDTYRNIKGKRYIQYTDFANPFDESGKYVEELSGEAYDLKTAKKYIDEIAKKEYPNDEFIAVKQPEGFYRIYQRDMLPKTESELRDFYNKVHSK